MTIIVPPVSPDAHDPWAARRIAIPFANSSAAATRRLTAMKLSGLTDIKSIPHATRNSANSGWSLGAWPHNPTLAPAL